MQIKISFSIINWNKLFGIVEKLVCNIKTEELFFNLYTNQVAKWFVLLSENFLLGGRFIKSIKWYKKLLEKELVLKTTKTKTNVRKTSRNENGDSLDIKIGKDIIEEVISHEIESTRT